MTRSTSKPQPNRRAFLRYDVRQDGLLLFVDPPCFVECTVRDIFADGAHLRVSVAALLPQRVLLWVQQTGAIHECEVRWRKDRTVGVRFVDSEGRGSRRAEIEKGFAPLRNAPAGRFLLH